MGKNKRTNKRLNKMKKVVPETDLNLDSALKKAMRTKLAGKGKLQQS